MDNQACIGNNPRPTAIHCSTLLSYLGCFGLDIRKNSPSIGEVASYEPPSRSSSLITACITLIISKIVSFERKGEHFKSLKNKLSTTMSVKWSPCETLNSNCFTWQSFNIFTLKVTFDYDPWTKPKIVFNRLPMAIKNEKLSSTADQFHISTMFVPNFLLLWRKFKLVRHFTSLLDILVIQNPHNWSLEDN